MTALSESLIGDQPAAPSVMPAAPRVLAVTVNYNGGAFLAPFLESFRALTYPNVGLIVVDNASHDGSWAEVGRLLPDATLVRATENTGFTGGNNRAVREALRCGADFVLFLNNDTRLEPGLIEAMLAEAGPRTIVAPRVLLDGTAHRLDDTVGDFSWLRGAWKDWVFNRTPPAYLRHTGPADMASLTALLIPAAAFHEAGLLDERLFMYYEDFDFIRRAQLAGFRLRHAPAARLWHRRAASSGGGETPFKHYYATRNRLAVLRRHQPAAVFPLAAALIVATRLLRAIGFAVRGRRDLATAVLAGSFDAARGRMGRTRHPAGEP